jgi:RimJ/RimL family protein N-acetyltransferase
MSTITIFTTLPYLEDESIGLLETPRLIIRPLVHPADLKAYRTIRSQPEAMTSSNTGLPDSTLEKTEMKLKRLQPPYQDSHIYFGIFLKNPDNSEGEIIGDGGVHKFMGTDTGWPEFGYKFKKEFWGLGYATEFAKAFMEHWWNNFPRKRRKITIIPGSADFHDTLAVTEQVCAWTKKDNEKSEKVLKKIGFQKFQGLDNGMTNWRLTKDLFESKK